MAWWLSCFFLVFPAVIDEGEIAGLFGVVFVPTVAMLRMLFDFFRVRLRTRS